MEYLSMRASDKHPQFHLRHTSWSLTHSCRTFQIKKNHNLCVASLCSHGGKLYSSFITECILLCSPLTAMWLIQGWCLCFLTTWLSCRWLLCFPGLLSLMGNFPHLEASFPVYYSFLHYFHGFWIHFSSVLHNSSMWKAMLIKLVCSHMSLQACLQHSTPVNGVCCF